MDEYSSGGGGKLKLKGSKVSDGRVKKKKSKKSSSVATGAEKDKGNESGELSSQKGMDQDSSRKEGSLSAGGGTLQGEEDGSVTTPQTHTSSKTEAEKRHEEMRRKRAKERLKREGAKTHKERVEDLNKYLSRLSEHHDMPKIGPG
ncbi:hypothetical protein BDW62DRAFT_203243 [Aspergillus aurantiobrunneus]